MIKPTLFPDWSVNTDGTDNDVVDPTSGENNVVEPTAAEKLAGWTYTQKPPRQYFNWLSRLTTQWLRWFESGSFESNFIDGLEISFSTSPTHDITVSAGVCSTSGNDGKIVVSTPITKQILISPSVTLDPWVDWAAGDNSGGVAAGLGTPATKQTVHFFVLYNPDSGAIDAGADTDVDATNLLADANVVSAGFTKYRRVASFIVYDPTAGNVYYIRPFTQKGNIFTFDEIFLDYTSVTSSGLTAFTVPNDIITKAKVLINAYTSTPGHYMMIGDYESILTGPPYELAKGAPVPASGTNGVAGYFESRLFEFIANTSSQLFVNVQGAGIAWTGWTVGWTDYRGGIIQ